jgi:hypothetical protein
MLRDTKVRRFIEHIVDATEQPYHQRLDQVGVLLIVDSLEVKTLEAG